MKKIVVVLAMLALVGISAFAVDLSVGVELGTGFTFNTGDMDKSEYFYGPNYGDVGISLGIENDIFGAYTAFGAGDGGQADFTMYDTNAWIKLGSFSKIQIGDFSNSAANAGYVLGVVDEYDLGILRYGPSGSSHVGFSGDNTIAGDKLKNLVVDFYVGPATIQLAWLSPYLPSKADARLNYGGRVYGNIGDFADITFAATYDNPSTNTFNAEDRTTIGAFVGFPDLVANLGLLVGYTASIRMDDTELDHGIDLRVEMPVGDVVLALHNNLSMYGDKQMVLYNELGAGMSVTDAMYAKLRVRSQYYDDGANDTSVYDFGAYLNFDYSITEWAMISTGVEVKNIGNDTTDVTIGIPVTFKVWY